MDTQQVVQDLLDMGGNGENPNIQPSILMSVNIDPARVAEMTSYNVNHACAPAIKALLETGWIILRVQTEVTNFGHETIAYLVKLKGN